MTDGEMFKFDFKVDHDGDETPFDSVEKSKEKGTTAEEKQDVKVWYDSEEVIPSLDILDNIDVCKLNCTNKELKDGTTIRYMVSGFLLEDIKENGGDEITDIKRAEEKHSDLIPAVYEGGAKIWECTDDLLTYLAENFKPADWKGKSVLDLGCGAGLLGIYAFKNDSSVTFQDYNKDVLEKITIPNVLLNAFEIDDSDEEIYNMEKVKENSRFYSGDWQKWSKAESSLMYDVILSCETIYNAQNQQKLLNCLYDKLKEEGQVYIAAKTYYFGVGGGLRQFEELIGKDQRFNFKSVWLSTDGVNREIIHLSKAKK